MVALASQVGRSLCHRLRGVGRAGLDRGTNSFSPLLAPLTNLRAASSAHTKAAIPVWPGNERCGCCARAWSWKKPCVSLLGQVGLSSHPGGCSPMSPHPWLSA